MKARHLVHLGFLLMLAVWSGATIWLIEYFRTTDQRGHPPAAVLCYPVAIVGILGAAMLLLAWVVAAVFMHLSRRDK